MPCFTKHCHANAMSLTCSQADIVIDKWGKELEKWFQKFTLFIDLRGWTTVSEFIALSS